MTPDAAKAVQAAVQKQGGAMEVCIYEADHAFFNDTRPEVYSAENAKLAWERSLAFLKKHAAASA